MCPLVYLNLSNNDITSSGVQEFESVLTSQHLFELDLSYNPIGDLGIKFLEDPLSRSNIRLLNLSDCKIQSGGA